MQKTPKYLQHWRFKCGQVTCVDGEPIGFVTWDPRNRPEYVEIGHNGIREKYKDRESAFTGDYLYYEIVI